MSGLLNATVCNGVRITAVTMQQGRRVQIGYNIGADRLDATEGIPLALGRRPPRLSLALSYRLVADDAGQYLMVESSFMGLSMDRHLDKILLHYDYEREKADGYPEAHLQIVAESEAWATACPQGRALDRLHLPVGGRRYRPTLEDLVEFLIREDLAEGRKGWESPVQKGREGFHQKQMRAAIRRDPQTAREILDELDRP